MRKVQLLFVCLMLSAAAFAADKVVKLPKPNLNRTGTVMKALSERNQSFGCWKTNGSFRYE